MKTVRIGTGAGFSGDRIQPAVQLAAEGNLDFLVFECLAERTIALAQLRRLNDPNAGYDPFLTERMTAVLPDCARTGVRIVSNMGAANPLAAGRETARIAKALGLSLKIAVITGDDILEAVRQGHAGPEASALYDHLGNRVISANAYIGAFPIAAALDEGADVVITGRAADPALFMGPLIHSFGWKPQQCELLGRGVLTGHLLECGAQVTGGYFADPGVKDVPALVDVGFPIGEVDETGGVVISKLEGTGGSVSPATVAEQLLYEVHDPTRYYQPDVIADFSKVEIMSVRENVIRLSGASGTKKTGMLKASVGYRDGFQGEGQISYAGPNAVRRAQLAGEIIETRLRRHDGYRDLRIDLIGINSVLGCDLSTGADPYEVRLRCTARADDKALAERVGREVEALYLNGPAGGGGATASTRETVAIAPVLVPETTIELITQWLEAP
ncbi:DUF1446 domain-containing protein [Paracoccus stylophorae]|uniref:DUF1446 domain-containing protein n=1 Tax=Paracoccus stylophorae TaxID=659350 RepID=A0ABY7SRX7_9RHOB|nr:acyclic terpene utilization AtuA family protein [Paracoccus stylophorae]WCR09794.1 DUF1446 domain-containing protein [Paracoccus stylophorae]